MTLSKRAIGTGAAAIAIIGAGVVATSVWLGRHAEQAMPTIGGPFTLASATGPVSDTTYRGRWMLIYFGYTHCPDACPTTLGDMGAALDKMPAADRARIVPIFITVDPDRDTPAIIADYAKAFGPEFVGLSGTQDQITAAERVYRVYAAKHPLKGQDYAMDHSSVVYVMGPDGKFSAVISDGTSPAEMAERLVALGV
jgi:protein SCO1/2